MTTQPVALPDGEIFAASDRMILVDQFESVAAAGFVLGKEGTELAIHITFTGKLNRRDERDDVTIALSPLDTLQLVEQLTATLELLRKQQ